MPLVTIKTVDKTGFELIAEEGGSPVFIDLHKRHKNLLVCGTTRSGKSVLISGILTQALAHNFPISVMDYPKPDGSSTFSDYTHFFGDKAAYFDISSESFNLFELPNLGSLAPKLQNERFTDYHDFQHFKQKILIISKTFVL